MVLRSIVLHYCGMYTYFGVRCDGKANQTKHNWEQTLLEIVEICPGRRINFLAGYILCQKHAQTNHNLLFLYLKGYKPLR